ncbi:DHA2 family efflux MFS transporter permease subunit [Aneurinibacillus sp. Ricciae_BoGa-3]|uniref:DHA2 family efflux MFS transporter permease subunit n=1 Tax=Aneurinibacillus sp. Ricciae_BoGa-3 TaxID=3022697 RepID=UPI00234169AD|nr:DHA2 family efflux MFS transporter permease subunit [Aneurinibacillus sp. Ricciae_BoGa-3]WCK53169.1 DHA2 family efflux MFS transporter permease subunit [Aneurinibacillus sp. Ricciae_BoGa-3]
MENEMRTGRIVTVLVLGMFIAILNQTLINVAIPHMMNDLNVSTSTVQWLSTGFMLANAVLIPVSAFLIETFTTRKLFMAAMIFFTIGSLFCGIAPNYSLVLIGRLVQAVGAGILMPLVSNVFLRIFPPEKMGKAMGLMGIAMMFAPAVGPTLSGWIVQNYSWRILFYIMVPLGALEILLAAVWLSNISKLTFPKFDFWGAFFSTLGFGGILYGLSEAGDKGWGSFWVLGPMYIGFLFLVLFVRRELTTDQPLVDLRVFKFDIYSLTTVVSMIVNMAMFGGMLLLPIYIQNIRGFTPLQSGLLLLPGAILMGIMSPISGALFDKIGIRPLAIVGLTITTITTYQFTKLTAETTYAQILVLYAMRMFGMSFLMMTIMTAGFNQLPVHLKSHGNAMSNTLRQVAGSIGTALLVTVMSTRSTIHLTNYANVVTSNNPYAVQTLTEIGQGLAAAAGLPSEAGSSLGIPIIYQSAAAQASISGINDAFIVATMLTMVALVISCFIRRNRA